MKELLVPVGSMESLNAAIHNGCDAVYLGGKKFGARAFATNFDDEEMLRAIKLCHLYGVKIYVTVNTLIHESELASVLDYLKFLYKSGVDAVIIQDIGLMASARREIPDLEIHASTQVHSTNSNTLKLLTDLGVKRVVLAREMSIDEINKLDTILEIEAFIHGALCISYSGQCLFSSVLMNRSGNRGSCAQVCRLPFKIIRDSEEIKTDGDYLLSTKELNTAEHFKEIMESNIYSLKIEGRMKGAEYVGCVTSLYRDLMDKYYRGEEVIPDKKIMKDLMTIFN
ncbi:MAG: U32 family peptidase, partial [Bacilli bacterium]|nr:U32 family peptidase [Bacilli bacterium]